MTRTRLPVPEIPIRRKPLQRHCTCGQCKLCRDNDAKLRSYRRMKAGIQPLRRGPRPRKAGRADIDMDALNAYWDRVKL